MVLTIVASTLVSYGAMPPFFCLSPCIVDHQISGFTDSTSFFIQVREEGENIYFRTEVPIAIERSKLHTFLRGQREKRWHFSSEEFR